MDSNTTGASAANGKLCDNDEIDRALKYFLPDGQVAEVRILDATAAFDRWRSTYSGYFNDREKLIGALSTIESAKGFYITLNPVDPALLARAANRIRRALKDESTSNRDITGRRRILIDFDPQRPAGLSSTDPEHAAAIERAEAVRDFFATPTSGPT